MDQRPKPGEDEDDLLKLQQQFLNSGGSQKSSVTLKRPDKRKTQVSGHDARDVVDMEGVQMSIDPQHPLKKSKFKQEQEYRAQSDAQRVMDEETMEDLERAMDRKDSSVAAVLTSIIERDTRNEICAAPQLGTQAFPSVKAFNMSAIQKGGKKKKKSLFAQQIEAQGPEHFGVDPSRKAHPSKAVGRATSSQSSSHLASHESLGKGSCILDGTGLSVSNKKAEVNQIHQENTEKLASMTEEEILEEQKKLLEMIDPKLVNFMRRKSAAMCTSNTDGGNSSSKSESFSVLKERKRLEKQSEDPALESHLPIKPSKEWVHMDTVEKDKLEWLKDLPPPPSAQAVETSRSARFDFEGNVLAVDVDIPVNMGLHHHGDEPERAGYTLEELFQLSRSSHQQQRTLALHTLARIISKAQSGHLSDKVQSPIVPTILAGGVLMLLRLGLDDSVVAVASAAVDALHALLWNPLDENGLEIVWLLYQGEVMSSLVPSATLEKESQPEELDDENQEEETDADVARRDVVQALVRRMDVLVRFRYIMESMHPQADTVIKMLEILTRLAQHSQVMAYEIVKCPGLLDKIMREFVPTAWSLKGSGPISDLYGIPVPAAVKLVRVLCQCGRNLTSGLIAKYNIKLVILRFLSVETCDLQLPQKEAGRLQLESLALWRVCAAYGLATEVYFDMYSNIVTCLGQMGNQWSAPSSAPSHSRFSAHLICILEKMLHVAGQKKSISDERALQEVPAYEINWSHVVFLAQPLIMLCQKILAQIGISYPAKKQELHFPTVCMNFLASYFGLEGQQSGIDEVTSLDGVEQFCKSCLEPFLDSYGFKLIVEHLCSFSNLLVHPTETWRSTVSPNLPSHGVILIPQASAGLPSSAVPEQSETFKSNMPILLPHSPFGFLTALLRLVLSLSKRHKAMISKVLRPVVKNKDILMYMKKTCTASNSSPFCTSLFTREENLLQYMWLKCCVFEPCDDMSVAHRVSLNLLSRLGHGDEHLVHDLITTVTFNQAFLSEGAEMNLTSDAMESLSLHENLHLKSATQEEITISRSTLLQGVYNSLAKIRGHYLMSFGGMEKAVINSRNLLVGKPTEISALMFKCSGESLMPKDWMYLPLIHIYNKAAQSQSASGMSLSPLSVGIVSSVLQWNYALEMWRPVEMSQISATVRLCRILCAFIAGNDLFLEKPVNQYLAGLLRVFSSQKVIDKLDFEEKIPGMTSFYDLYQEVLDHYEAVSFGDPVFGLFVLLPLQQRHSSMLRKAMWGERRKMLRTLRVPLNELLIPVQNFLHPEETDHELLHLQLSAVISGAVQPSWSPVLYLIAVHHVNRFLYMAPGTEGDMQQEKAAARERMWTRVISSLDKVQNIIFFKHCSVDQPSGMDLYETLPQNRQATLDHYTSKFNAN